MEKVEGDPTVSWFRANVGTVITVALLMTAIVAQWQSFGRAAELAEAVEARFRIHELDNRRHVDPDRDRERWDELMRRLDRIERKVQ